MPMRDQTIPLATMGEVQEKAETSAVVRERRIIMGREYILAAPVDDLLSRLSDFMRRCDDARLGDGEVATTDKEWDAAEAEVNAAIGAAPAPVKSPSPDLATLNQVITDIAAELGCEPDNEVILAKIAALKSVIESVRVSEPRPYALIGVIADTEYGMGAVSCKVDPDDYWVVKAWKAKRDEALAGMPIRAEGDHG